MKGVTTIIVCFLLALFQHCVAQGFLDLRDTLPECSNDCYDSIVNGTNCAPTDISCFCTSELNLRGQFTLCFLGNCTSKELLSSLNTTAVMCGDPIRDRSSITKAVTLTFAPIALVALLMRLAIKGFGLGGGFWWDDYAIIVCALVTIPYIWSVYTAVSHGVGRDFWKIPFTKLTTTIHRFYICAITYKLSNTFNKVSILCFYLRIFPTHGFRIWVWAMIIFNLCLGFTFAIGDAVHCSPPSYFWHSWDGEHKGTCANLNTMIWVHSSINIACDVIMILLPLWKVRKLQLRPRKKMAVAFIFLVGFFVTIVSGLRLQSLTEFENTTNPTWDYAPITYWSMVEVNVGIICANLPALHSLMTHYRKDKTEVGNSAYYIDSAKQNSAVNGTGDRRNGPRRGIQKTESFDVKYVQKPDGDGDSTSELVENKVQRGFTSIELQDVGNAAGTHTK